MQDDETGADGLTYMDFVREAFNVSPRVTGLGNLPVNWMALAGIGTLGLLNPGFWFLGAGLELGFLFAMAQSPRFRNYVRGRRIQAAKQKSAAQWRERQAAILEKLASASRERFASFVTRIEAARSARDDADLGELIGDVADDGLHRLRWIYLRLLASAETIGRQVDPSVRETLQDELDEYVQRLDNLGPEADNRIRRSLEQTVGILRQRMQNLENAGNNLTYIDSELRRIEHQAELIIEEATLATDADALSSRIDAVTSTFQETQEWMRLNRELLSDYDDDLDDGRPPPQRLHA